MQLPISVPWLPRIARDQLSAEQGAWLCARWRARFGARKTKWAHPTSFAGLAYSAIISAMSKPSELPQTSDFLTPNT
jgi:hypothetical protein